MTSNPKAKTPKRIRPSIRHDTVAPGDLLYRNFARSCEECTHFKASDKTCTLGYHTIHHLRATQDAAYTNGGRMALCRFMEID